jgi:hypothetical protein
MSINTETMGQARVGLVKPRPLGQASFRQLAGRLLKGLGLFSKGPKFLSPK